MSTLLNLNNFACFSNNNPDWISAFSSNSRFKIRKSDGFVSQPKIAVLPFIDVEFFKLPVVCVQDTFQVTSMFVADLTPQFLNEIKDDRCIYLCMNLDRVNEIEKMEKNDLNVSHFYKKIAELTQENIYILKQKEYEKIKQTIESSQKNQG